jgi:hypothetical protein
MAICIFLCGYLLCWELSGQILIFPHAHLLFGTKKICLQSSQNHVRGPSTSQSWQAQDSFFALRVLGNSYGRSLGISMVFHFG